MALTGIVQINTSLKGEGLEASGTFEVVNTSKRTVERCGVVFPARKGDDTTPVVVEVRSKAQHLALRACRVLEVKATSKRPTADTEPADTAGAGEDDTEGGFDPSSANVGEVKDHVGDDPEVAAEVLDAELAGKNRPTLVEWLEEVAGAGEDGDE